MDTKFIAVAVVSAALVATGSFFVGVHYSQAKMPMRFGQGQNGGFQRQGRGPNGLNFAGGKVIAKDSNSITLELGGQNASSTNSGNTGSRIVFFGQSTQFGKFVTGNLDDIQIGQMVTVNGTPNSDGSISASLVQIRPDTMPGFMPRRGGGQ